MFKFTVFIILLSNSLYAGISCSASMDQTLLDKVQAQNCSQLSDNKALDAYLLLSELKAGEMFNEGSVPVFEAMFRDHSKEIKTDICKEVIYLSKKPQEQRDIQLATSRADYPALDIESKAHFCEELAEILE